MYIYEFMEKMKECSDKEDIRYADQFRTYMSQLRIREDPIINEKVVRWLSYDPMKNLKQYIRQPIYRIGNMELVLIIWHPHSTTPVHFHPHYGCLFRIVQGTLHSETYLDDDRSSIYKVDKVAVMNEGDIDYTRGQHGIHRVFNPTDRMSISIHLYIHRQPLAESKTISLP